MKDVINNFYEDYVKVLKMTKTHYNNLIADFKKVKLNINKYEEASFSSIISDLKINQHKLMVSYYLMVDAYLKISHLYNQFNEKQQSSINEYNKVSKKVAKINNDVMDFIVDYSPNTTHNL